jgi:two-component system nitrogen regulation response regulator GlnG
MSAARVLVADDENSIRFVLREALEEAGHEVVDVDSGEAAWAALAAGGFDVAFLDIRMPEPTGLELLDRLRNLGSDTSVVVITAQNTLENAVEAMKRGALDYLVKPFQIVEVLGLVDKAIRTRALEREVRALRREARGRSGPGGDRLVGKSGAILEVFKTIGRVAARDVAVLITGESGTGKELVTRAIHQASPRAAGAFVAVNAAAIPRELLESELFGHERGAFTGATESRPGRFREASGGTLFLDEIGDMPLELQAKLLRVLQSGEVTSVGGKRAEKVDVRIVAATHRDLDVLVRDGRFREDLLYRLRVVPIHIPPLRERPEDIPVLAQHFVERYAQELGTSARWLSEEALEFLSAYAWPGNVRELENAIKRALVLSGHDVLTPEDFAFLSSAPAAAETGAAGSLEELVQREVEELLRGSDPRDVYPQILERTERPLLEAVLAHTNGNQLRAAALLGINRNTLRKKITELGISIPERP